MSHPTCRRLATLTAVAAVLSLSATGPAGAQQEAPAAVFRELTEVNVVNVEVVVTDRRNQPVTGLTQEDFELFENGQPVAISNFYAVAGGDRVPETAVVGTPPQAGSPQGALLGRRESRQSHLIVYVDNANIAETHRRRVFNRLREFLRESWRDDLWVMVVANDRSLAIRQDFTADAGDVFRTLDRIAAESTSQPRLDAQRRNLMRLIEDVNVEAGSGLFGTKLPGGISQESYTNVVAAEAEALLPLIRAYSQERLQQVRDTVRILDHFVAMAAGMPGRKSVLYVSDGLSLRPGEALYEGYSRRFYVLADVGARVSPELEASREDATADFRELVTRANTGGVTFYTLDAAPASVLARGSAENVAGAGGNFGSWKDAIESTEQSNRQDSLVMMADGTGGRYGLTPAAFDDLFAGILTDFDNYYSLGYVADRLESGKERDIKVELRGGRRDLRVRYRQSFRDKTLVERASERASAALLVQGLDNPLEVSLEPRDREPQEDGNVVVHLLVKLPLGKLVLLPDENGHQGQVSMFVAVRDDKGRTSEVRHHQCPIRIPAAEVETARDRSAACGVRLLMRPGRQTVAVSVLDELAAVHSTASLVLDVGAGVEKAALR